LSCLVNQLVHGGHKQVSASLLPDFGVTEALLSRYAMQASM
jgi:hypothetical protein